MSFNEWKSYLLGDICGYSKDRINISEVNIYNYISTENMFPERAGITIANTLPNAKSVVEYKDSDTLISNIRPYFKKIWYANRTGGASNDVLVFRKNSPLVDNKFLYYFLSQDNFFDYMVGTSKGTKMPRGDKDAILKYSISLPPLKEQKAIAHILSTLNEKIEVNNEINKKLEEMAQAIFKQWFVDFEFPNEKGKPYKSSSGEMVESEMGMIPEGWKLGKLSKIGYFKNGKNIKTNLRIDNGTNLIFGSNGVIGATNETLQEDACIIIGRVGAYCGSIRLTLKPCWVTDNAIIALPLKKSYLSYLYYYLLQASLKELAGGSAQPLINQNILNNLKILLPNEEILEEFYYLHLKTISNIDSNNDENLKLSKIRDLLLPKLMSGKIYLK